MYAQTIHWKERHQTFSNCLHTGGGAVLSTNCNMQALISFAEKAEGCCKFELGPGDTLLLPCGWPHAVVTPEDSLVVGGNFLHGFDLRCDASKRPLIIWMICPVSVCIIYLSCGARRCSSNGTRKLVQVRRSSPADAFSFPVSGLL